MRKLIALWRQRFTNKSSIVDDGEEAFFNLLSDDAASYQIQALLDKQINIRCVLCITLNIPAFD